MKASQCEQCVVDLFENCKKMNENPSMLRLCPFQEYQKPANFMVKEILFLSASHHVVIENKLLMEECYSTNHLEPIT